MLVLWDLVCSLREETAAAAQLYERRLEDVAHLVVHAGWNEVISSRTQCNHAFERDLLLQSLPKTVISRRVCMSQISDRGLKSGDYAKRMC